VGEAWERVQQFHDQGFGFEATLAENPRPSSAAASGPTSWRDHFNSWWAGGAGGGGGGGGGGGDYGGGYGGGYGEPRECSANCQCSFCTVGGPNPSLHSNSSPHPILNASPNPNPSLNNPHPKP
jgi:hypothetical protein